MVPFDPVLGWWTDDAEAEPDAPVNNARDRRSRYIGGVRSIVLFALTRWLVS